MHLNEGQLRAFLDDELAARDVASHLAACAECRARRDEIAARAERVAAHLASLELSSAFVIAREAIAKHPVGKQSPSGMDAYAASPQSCDSAEFTLSSGEGLRSGSLLAMTPYAALARFKTRRLQKESFPMQKIFNRRYRPAWAMLALVALIAVSMTLPPVRAWAQGVLAQFRVSKVTVVSIDPTRLQELGVGSSLSKQITQLLSDSVTLTRKPDAPRAVANAQQASQVAGFQVRLPASRSDTPQLTVQGGATFEMTVNRARTQTLLNEAGASHLVLPASIDGAVVKVDIPRGVAAGYGNCPELMDESSLNGTPSRTMSNCIIVTQIPSPSVDAPPTLDVQQLAELGLQFTGMTKEQAHAYAQTVDWTSTLVMPIPRNAAQYKPINVDGVSGYLIQRPLGDAPQYLIIWVKNGVIYAVGGQGSDTTAALAMANSLK